MKKVLIFALCVLLCPALGACGASESEPAEMLATPTPEPTATPVPDDTPAPDPTPTPVPEAEELSVTLTDNLGGYFEFLLDNDPETYITYKRDTWITVHTEEDIGFLYLCWFRPPTPYVVHVNGGGFGAGENGFIYEYIEIPEGVREVQLSFSARESIADIRAFSRGVVPENIQRWQPPLQQADVLVFPTHCDDETVFFGALIASCIDRGLDVQLAYMIEHFTDMGYAWHTRTQEMLTAVWELGIRNYPIIGPFQDHFVTSWKSAEKVFDFSTLIGYQVEQIRRFKPLVIVGHDIYGEYGHGGHQMNAQALTYAVNSAANEKYYPASAKTWGVWDTPKFYVHMYEKNTIMIDVETPLERFGGRTAFEVASDAMEFHVSQLQYSHRPMLDSEEFPRYDCRMFGLYRSTVGEDTGTDIMEHVQ